MLEIRLQCENCQSSLPVDSEQAMICSFECTFCKECVDNILHNVCPNCSGGFVNRPIRPKKHLVKYPPKKEAVYKPIDMNDFKTILAINKDIKPKDR